MNVLQLMYLSSCKIKSYQEINLLLKQQQLKLEAINQRLNFVWNAIANGMGLFSSGAELIFSFLLLFSFSFVFIIMFVFV